MRPHKAPSQGIGRELGTHKRSCPDLKHQTTGCNVRPGPERSEGPASGVLPLCTARTRSAVRVPARTGHSQEIVPGLKAPTNGWLISPDLNEVRVQHQTTGCNVRPGPERSEGPAFNALPRYYPRTRNLVRVHQVELFLFLLFTHHSSFITHHCFFNAATNS